MTARRALVTGAGGFVGSCLARRLISDGHDVDLIVRPGSLGWRLAELGSLATIREVDLRDEEALRRAVAASAPDWVFHLAAHGAYSWQTDPRGIIESNLMGTLALARACCDIGFDAFVQAGSSSEYGRQDHAPSEREAPEPNSIYAVSKVAATLLCRHLAAAHDLRMVTLRLYSVYGPWEDPRRLMPVLVAHALRGELPPLVDPDTARDFVHVDDVCDAFLAAAGSAAATADAIYNVGSGTQTTLGEVVDVARTVFGVHTEPQWGSHEARSWDTDVWRADPSLIEQHLGWTAQRDLGAGMRSLADWLRLSPALWERYRVSVAP